MSEFFCWDSFAYVLGSAKVNMLWTHVCDIMGKILWTTIVPDPCLCLLNDDTILNFKVMYRIMLFCGFTAVEKKQL